MLKFSFIIILLILEKNSIWIECVDSNGYSFDDDIMGYLLINKSYNKLVRPDSKVTVYFQLSYRQLVSIDEKSQIMTSNIYLYANWYDSRLVWDPESYSGLEEIIMPATKLWLPDFAIINSAGTSNFISITDSNQVIISNDGYVFLTVGVTSLQTRCKISVYKFPFDSQNCSILIGSWQLDTNRIDFTSDESKVSTEDFITNGIWILRNINVRSVFTNSRFRFGNIINEDIAFDVIITRRYLYYMTTFIPCYVLNIATLLAFFVTNQITIQVNLCMTTFLTYGVYSLKIAGDVTTQSEYFPLASIYFIIAICYTLISLTWFICANFYNSRNRLPKWMSLIAGCVRTILFREFKVESLKKDNKIIKVVDLIEAPNKVDCKKCEENKEKENDKKKQKEIFDLNMLALNYLVFFIVFTFMLVTNLSIWISISS